MKNTKAAAREALDDRLWSLCMLARRYPNLMPVNILRDKTLDVLWMTMIDTIDNRIADGGWPCLADTVAFVDGWHRDREKTGG